jgi:hypothetical protein
MIYAEIMTPVGPVPSPGEFFNRLLGFLVSRAHGAGFKPDTTRKKERERESQLQEYPFRALCFEMVWSLSGC